MQYRLLENPEAIRRKFQEAYVLSYEAFCASHADWIGKLRTEFNEAYYAKMYMWDRLVPGKRQISFADAVSYLKARAGEVLFLTEELECVTCDFCQLGKNKQYVAASSVAELAEWAAYEWFTEFRLEERGCYLADPVLPSDFYIFDESYRWCVVLTHETDEEGMPASRVCFLVEKGEK